MGRLQEAVQDDDTIMTVDFPILRNYIESVANALSAWDDESTFPWWWLWDKESRLWKYLAVVGAMDNLNFKMFIGKTWLPRILSRPGTCTSPRPSTSWPRGRRGFVLGTRISLTSKTRSSGARSATQTSWWWLWKTKRKQRANRLRVNLFIVLLQTQLSFQPFNFLP